MSAVASSWIIGGFIAFCIVACCVRMDKPEQRHDD